MLQQLPQQCTKCRHEGFAVSQVLQMPDSDRKTTHPLLSALVTLRKKVQNFTCTISSTSKVEAKTDISIQAVEKSGLSSGMVFAI